MNKIILFLIAVTIGLSAQADYTVQTSEPLYSQNYSSIQPYQQYPQYQGLNPLQSGQIGQPIGFSAIQPYGQNYNQGYYNPYQHQTQCVNPYQYPNYGYGNNLQSAVIGSALSGLGGNTVGAPSIMKNIVQSVIYSKLRGY